MSSRARLHPMFASIPAAGQSSLASTTNDAVDEPQLVEGKKAIAVIKASEVLVGVDA
jgi:molybdopterin-binding protein